NIEKLGASISSFGYGLNTKIFNDIIDSFRNGSTSSYDIFSTGFDIDFMFHALKGHSVIDIFQSPTMLLTNGVESVVTSVVNVPYLKTTSTVDSNTNSTIEQYDYKDIGLQIKVMPKIKKGLVYIDLNLVSDELITIEDDKPITQKITYTNSVRIKKGKPILLTGIKKTSQSFSKDGIPLLSDLPLLGALFRGTSTTTEEQNINILIEVL
ncbi:MAG: hypothetical protein Q9M39_03755, partial [Sulfurovum sp.]|nr:hypothetical protein [Sulfurovum sp.]